jgi:hypothetical protein
MRALLGDVLGSGCAVTVEVRVGELHVSHLEEVDNGVLVGLQEATSAQKGRGRGEGAKEGIAEGSGCVVSMRINVFLIGVCELSMLL